jgi:hypothetical protein
MKRFVLAGVCALVFVPVMAPGEVRADDVGAAVDVAELRAALELPRRAHALRQVGVAEAELGEALRVLRERAPQGAGEARRSRAARAEEVLRAEEETAREHGRMRGLGEFVRDQVEDGARGQALAEAIREHRERRDPAGRSAAEGEGGGKERAAEARDGASAGDKGSAGAAERAAEGRERAAEVKEQGGEAKQGAAAAQEASRGQAGAGADQRGQAQGRAPGGDDAGPGRGAGRR